MIGEKLGDYRILRKIGSGGMGDVYAAEDTKLGREVAMKVLPPAVASDRERLTRFQREARVIAALEHPNIVTLYSIDHVDESHFITMELVSGTTLSEAIPKRGFPLDRFFELAIPLADAVGAAHERGVTHRDLKPSNVMVAEDGTIRILDFGLAKLRQEFFAIDEISDAATDTQTEEGKVLGTVAYMSPEQAEGRVIDHRSDIFSMGIILYEMATGAHPFHGDTKNSMISSIIKDSPASVTDLKRALPRHLGRIIKLSLEKDPGNRYQSAWDVRNELEGLRAEVESGELELLGRPTELTGPRRALKYVAGAAVLVAAVALGYSLSFLIGGGTDTGAVPVVQSVGRVTDAHDEEWYPSLSPDGEDLVYARAAGGDWDIFRQRVEGANPVNLTEDSVVDDTQPAFSPNGRMIAFRSDRGGGGIFVMGATGESPKRVVDSGYNPSWSPDGREVLYATEEIAGPGRLGAGSELWAVDHQSGAKRRIYASDAVQPCWSPGGYRIAFWTSEGGNQEVWTIAADGSSPVRVTESPAVDWNPVWSPDGSYLYFLSDRSGIQSLWRVRIDEQSGRVEGVPASVGAIRVSGFFSISRDGRRVAFSSGEDRVNLQRLTLDPTSESIEGEPEWLTRGVSASYFPAPSPDDRLLAYVRLQPQFDLSVLPLGSGGPAQHLTDDEFQERNPTWSPDGAQIYFFTDRSGSFEIWRVNPDGSDPQQLTDYSEKTVGFPVISPDGSQLAYTVYPDATSFIQDLGSDDPPLPLPLIQEPGLGFQPSSWSRDGSGIVGNPVSESGLEEGIYAYSVATGEYQMLAEVGHYPLFLSDSRRILFWHDEKLLLLDSASGETKEILAASEDLDLMSTFSLSWDDRHIYTVRGEILTDIWLMTLAPQDRN